MHKEFMMNMDFHWQAIEDVLHSSEHVGSSGPDPSGLESPVSKRTQQILFAVKSPMLGAVEGQNPLPHVLRSLFLVWPKTYMIYMNVISISPNLSHL